jgi:hypothetical protein
MNEIMQNGLMLPQNSLDLYLFTTHSLPHQLYERAKKKIKFNSMKYKDPLSLYIYLIEYLIQKIKHV